MRQRVCTGCKYLLWLQPPSFTMQVQMRWRLCSLSSLRLARLEEAISSSSRTQPGPCSALLKWLIPLGKDEIPGERSSPAVMNLSLVAFDLRKWNSEKHRYPGLLLFLCTRRKQNLCYLEWNEFIHFPLYSLWWFTNELLMCPSS